MDANLPSRRTLLISTLTSILIAGVLLVTVILPAEYGLDVTGAGAKLGLTQLSQATQDAGALASDPLPSSAPNPTKIVEQINLGPGEGIEFKVQMAQHAKARYQWMAFGAPLHFDHHGEPEGDTSGFFESYAIGESVAMEGHFTTPFAGTHGWYWENRSDSEVTVQLVVEGEFSEL